MARRPVVDAMWLSRHGWHRKWQVVFAGNSCWNGWDAVVRGYWRSTGKPVVAMHCKNSVKNVF